MSNGRKVSTDALETLGRIIDDTQKRDAIHLAVLPMVAVETMKPGETCGPVPGGAAPYAVEKLGIVDPFLTAPVQKGERFWMVLRPRLVTSLRHVWSHMAFADEGAPDIAKEPISLERSKWWITNWAESSPGISYDEAIDGAEAYLKYDDYMSDGGRWEDQDVPAEFWDHYEVVTGEKVPTEKRGGFFSCAC